MQVIHDSIKEHQAQMPTLTLLETLRLAGPSTALLGANALFRAHHDRLVPLRPLLRKAHNLAMAVYSLWVFVHVSRVLASPMQHGWRTLVCDSVSQPAIPGWELSKYVELLDVALVYAAGRRPSNLLLYHHATAGLAVVVNTVGRPTPTPLYWIGSWMNAGVHAVMYLYYLWPRQLRVFKIWITLSQIAQHFAMVGLLITTPVMEDCDDVPHGQYAASLVLYASYLYLFVDFFTTTYKPKRA